MCRDAANKKWKTYRTRNSSPPGGLYEGDCTACKPVDEGPLPRRFQFTSYPYRLLIEAPARSLDPRLALDLTRYGELFARSHWAKQLGVPAVLQDGQQRQPQEGSGAVRSGGSGDDKKSS